MGCRGDTYLTSPHTPSNLPPLTFSVLHLGSDSGAEDRSLRLSVSLKGTVWGRDHRGRTAVGNEAPFPTCWSACPVLGAPSSLLWSGYWGDKGRDRGREETLWEGRLGRSGGGGGEKTCWDLPGFKQNFWGAR